MPPDASLDIVHRYTPAADEEIRFCELRYDVSDPRRLVGVAIRYGDVATFPWGETERFEPGAFGELANADVMMDVMHDRGRPIARTRGGGLTLIDSPTELRIEAILPESRDADDALTLVRNKVMRGLSISFKPELEGITYTKDKRDRICTVVQSATLKRVSVVDTPAYPKSSVSQRRRPEMDEDRFREMIEEALKTATKNRAGDAPLAPDEVARTVAAQLGASIGEQVRSQVADEVKSQVASVMAERDEAEAERAKAEDARKAAEAETAQQRVDMEHAAEQRAELITMVKPVLPADFEIRGKSTKELLVAAAGDEIEDAENRSDDYLLAKVEGIMERLAAASNGAAGGGTPAGRPTSRAGQPQLRRPVSAMTAPIKGRT